MKVDQWKKTDPDSHHFFRPFIATTCTPAMTESSKGNDGIDDSSETVSSVHNSDFTQTLLWVHQTGWQKDLLVQYGNTISLIDATYKTTKYELALFFICVRTNVGYSVVAEFTVQSETTEKIKEALEILKSWNPEWQRVRFSFN